MWCIVYNVVAFFFFVVAIRVVVVVVAVVTGVLVCSVASVIGAHSILIVVHGDTVIRLNRGPNIFFFFFSEFDLEMRFVPQRCTLLLTCICTRQLLFMLPHVRFIEWILIQDRFGFPTRPFRDQG